MFDCEEISRLYVSVLQEHIADSRVNTADIRIGIQNMKEVYKPDPTYLSSTIVDVANYNDVAHRCAYLHKYAPLHTALVAEMLSRAILEDPQLYKELIHNNNSGSFNLCCLGGGPGTDVIGVLAVLNACFGLFQVSATIIDCMVNWNETFASMISELRYGNYGSLGVSVSDQYFQWNYLEHNLLGKMTDQVNRAISRAHLITMVKFVSASACKDTPMMIKVTFVMDTNLFNSYHSLNNSCLIHFTH
ncbi:uncharacterized protein CEXT_211721 [Caerostris extrusa]|uniref:Uncharacterized protein n=1 Tax=Caerostris extrusa TaxID=172846 RepID=A0AAV4PM29_CAEEX|nr:uncharacterized protein CEXT_211721 [Caerostris extrusa]